MRSVIRVLLVAPLALGLSACLDATAPRLPPHEEEPDSTKQGAGYLGQAESPVPIG